MKYIYGLVLNATYYDFWFIKMNTFLHLNKCWDVVETQFKELETNALAAMNNSQNNFLEARRDQDLTTKWLMQSCIKESIFS